MSTPIKFFWNYVKRFIVHTGDGKCVDYFRSHPEEFIELTQEDFVRLLEAQQSASH